MTWKGDFLHPILFNAISCIWFNNQEDEGVTHVSFFCDKMPLATVALVAMVVGVSSKAAISTRFRNPEAMAAAVALLEADLAGLGEDENDEEMQADDVDEQ